MAMRIFPGGLIVVTSLSDRTQTFAYPEGSIFVIDEGKNLIIKKDRKDLAVYAAGLWIECKRVEEFPAAADEVKLLRHELEKAQEFNARYKARLDDAYALFPLEARGRSLPEFIVDLTYAAFGEEAGDRARGTMERRKSSSPDIHSFTIGSWTEEDMLGGCKSEPDESNSAKKPDPAEGLLSPETLEMGMKIMSSREAAASNEPARKLNCHGYLHKDSDTGGRVTWTFDQEGVDNLTRKPIELLERALTVFGKQVVRDADEGRVIQEIAVYLKGVGIKVTY